jgi:hypothetical protein
MRRAALTVALWGAFLAVLTTALWIWFPDALSVGLLGGAAVAAWAVAGGFALAVRRWSRDDLGDARALPEVSAGAAVTAVALAGMLYGAEFGFFLVLISAGLLALGLGRLAAELRAERRARGRRR